MSLLLNNSRTKQRDVQAFGVGDSMTFAEADVMLEQRYCSIGDFGVVVGSEWMQTKVQIIS